MNLPPLPSLETIAERLDAVFPEGTDERRSVTRDMGTKTVFVMFYVGAVEGAGGWLRPNQVTRMTDAQAAIAGDDERRAWTAASLRKAHHIPGRWYADTTREPIRDEVLRGALLSVGAVVENPHVKKTAQTPRWALARDFAELFTCSDDAFEGLLESWRARHLSAAARARLAAVRRGIVTGGAATGEVRVTLPNGNTRALSPGESAVIAKGVIEEFAPRFLAQPGVVWLSETSRRDERADRELADAVRLPIVANEVLPDIVLVDLGPDEPLFVFVEVVASDGPVTPVRMEALRKLLEQGGHSRASGAFVTALLDRGSGVYRAKAASQAAWGSFVWFASEPDKLVALMDTQDRTAKLSDLL